MTTLAAPVRTPPSPPCVDVATGSPFALIVVDVQHDFLPGGSLAVPNGDQVLGPIAQLAREAELVVASRDWHPAHHFSFSNRPAYQDGSWPKHCVQKTKGAAIHTSVRRYADYTISKGTQAGPPDQYSAFAGKTLRPVESLEEILARYPISTVVVAGLALDYCVQFTAFDAVAAGFRTIVPLDATRGVAQVSSDEATTRLINAGVEVIDTYRG